MSKVVSFIVTFFGRGKCYIILIRNILCSFFYLLCIFPLVMHHAMLLR